MPQRERLINGEPRTVSPSAALPSSQDANLQLFARSLAHDFNNLITGILGHASLIEAIAPADEPDIAESAAVIRKTAERAAELSSQLMNLSRTGASTVRPVNLHETIREVASLVSPQLSRGVRLYLDLRAERFDITGDSGQLHQVLLNLAVNARDAMPAGGSLTFATESSADMVVVRVADTGGGIPLELQQRVFEPLFTTKREGQGSGLGLAVVKRVVEQHSGAIELRSMPGFGAIFQLSFPLCHRTESAASLGALSAAAGL